MTCDDRSKTKATIDIAIVDGPVRGVPAPPVGEGGGEVVFLGRTRSETHEEYGDLVGLWYDVYENMANEALHTLAMDATRRWHAIHIYIRHARGLVPVGMDSVVIQVVCPHRAEAFDACRYLIDKLKTDVPIWKRENWSNGGTWSAGVALQT